MDLHEKLIESIMNAKICDVNDCLEEGADLSENNYEALRTAKVNVAILKNNLEKALAIMDFLKTHLFCSDFKRVK